MTDMRPSARVLLDSVSPDGHRLTTLEVVIHRYVLAELNTHRAFSRNSASSRAIPVAQQLARVMNDPAIPVVFPQEQRGMQGGAEVADAASAEQIWREAAKNAVDQAVKLKELGVHKSVTNRLLEPFMWHTVLVTATDWQNFFDLRTAPEAQPELRVAAIAMREAYEASTPQQLAYGEWHAPLLQPDEDERYWHSLSGNIPAELLKLQVSAARCARVSYLTHDGRRDIEKDLELYARLVQNGHWSPLEHVATPCTCTGHARHARHLGNFNGWDQLRHTMEVV